jgi:hypothetical protein
LIPSAGSTAELGLSPPSFASCWLCSGHPGFNLGGRRLPEGAAKPEILRSIENAQPWLALGLILRVLRLEPP